MIRPFVRSGSIVLLLSSLAIAADELPSMDELRKLEADKAWTDLLKSTTRVLALKGTAADPYDRAQVWMLKAEAQLQSLQFLPASDSYESGSEEKSAAPEVVDLCIALSEVLKKTDVRGYRPPMAPGAAAPQPIDVKDPEKRKDAVVALFEGEFAESKRDVERARQKAALPEMVKLAKRMAKLPALERAAVKSEERSKQLVVDLSTLTADIMRKWAKTAEVEVDRISKSANEMIKVDVRNAKNPDRRETALQKRGLSQKDKTDLQEVLKGCERVATTYKQYVEAIKTEPTGVLKSVTTDVEALYESAKGVLNENYSSDQVRTRS